MGLMIVGTLIMFMTICACFLIATDSSVHNYIPMCIFSALLGFVSVIYYTVGGALNG